MGKGERHNDTILWSEESDFYTKRAFDSINNPYEREENDLFVKKMKEFFQARGFSPESILHIGCSAGYKFPYLMKEFANAKLFGIDPGKKSIELAKKNMGGVNLKVGYAHDLGYEDESMDVIILPMVLQWIPRKYLVRTVSEIDRVAKKYLIIHDFLPYKPSWSISRHNQKVKIFKQDYTKLFEVYPWWKTIKIDMLNVADGEDYQRMKCILQKFDYSDVYTYRDACSEGDLKGRLWKP